VYVAEFWNTVSNISMIIPPLYGIWNAKKYALETRFFISHFMLLLGKLPVLFMCRTGTGTGTGTGTATASARAFPF
jgi:hypothetical protein